MTTISAQLARKTSYKKREAENGREGGTSESRNGKLRKFLEGKCEITRMENIK